MKELSQVSRIVYSMLGFFLVFLGLVYILNSFLGITGFVVIERLEVASSGSFGITLFLIGLFVLSRNRRRRGQAAMEFLMTYGWAILAAIIAIGILAYFGLFSQTTFSPSVAIINPPFYINAWNIISNGADSVVSLEIRNSGSGSFVTLTDIDLTSDAPGVSCLTNNLGANPPLLPGENIIVEIYCTGIDIEDKFSGDFVLKYKKFGSNLELLSLGEIRGRATEGVISNPLYYLVFVTSNGYSGNFGGLDGADIICENLANQVGGVPEGLNWVAWLSDSKINAIDRLGASSGVPFKLSDGITIIFNNRTDIADGGVLGESIDKDENGGVVSGNVWTGTNDGGIKSTFNCNNWAGGITGTYGVIGQVDVGWTSAGSTGCGLGLNKLYCFQQP